MYIYTRLKINELKQKPKCRRKRTKKIETSDIETIHKIEKINKSKFFEINKIGKVLVRLFKEKRKKT